MKAPAFQLYAADFYMDTVSWSAVEVGVYFRLLMHEWVNGPLPDSNAMLARIAGVDHKTMGKIWTQSVGKKFVQNAEGEWENSRLESTREGQRKYSESQKERVNKRWHKDDTGVLPGNNPSDTLHSSSSSSTSSKDLKKKNKDANAPSPSTQEAIAYFCDSVERRYQFKPQITGGDGRMVKDNLRKYSLDHVKDQIDFYLTIQKSQEHLTLKAALSAHTYNLFMKSKGGISQMGTQKTQGNYVLLQNMLKKHQEASNDE